VKKPIYPDLSSNVYDNTSKEQKRGSNASAPLFEDIELQIVNEQFSSPSNRAHYSTTSRVPASTIPSQSDDLNQLNTNSNDVLLLLDANEHLTVSSPFL
jgi:hypothetical protein